MILDFLRNVFITSYEALKSSSDWLIMSFIFAGILRNFVSPEKFQKMLGNNKLSSIFKSIFSAILLPVCSCGTFPIAISMYYSGAHIGPCLTFLTANPVLNPIAILLSLGLLGPKLTILYIITGLVLSILVGVISNKFSGNEISIYEEVSYSEVALEEEKKGFFEKIKLGIKWAFCDLAMMVCKYVVLGMILVGFFLALAKTTGLQQFLIDPNMISFTSVAILSAIMYVCAVGHIPFIAALIATGVAPGIAITFLMAGAATNLPELMTLYKLVGKRSMFIYFGVVVVGSILGGYITNLVLMPDFVPVLDYNKVTGTIEMANKLIIDFPDSVKVMCTILIVFIGCISLGKSLKTSYIKLANKLGK